MLQDKDLKLSDVLIRRYLEADGAAGRPHLQARNRTAGERRHDPPGRGHRGIRYPDRIILFDSPPLLATSESSVLATHMGQIVMVVEAEKTSQEAVREALRHIQSCEVVGMLLNKTTPTPGADYYYGYYGSSGK